MNSQERVSCMPTTTAGFAASHYCIKAAGQTGGQWVSEAAVCAPVGLED